jgi:CheY-like chemotaxis protein
MLRRKNETLDAQTDARLEAYAARDRTMLAQDIARHRPDVILVDRMLQGIDWLAWSNSYPALAEQLRPYRQDQTIRDILILRREPGR